MNYTLDDRHRSLRRFLMNALGSPPWTIRTERQPVRNEDKPIALVEAASPVATLFARSSIPQGDVEKQQTFSLMLYPARGDTAAEARLEASEWAEALEQAITVGMSDDVGDPPETVVLSAPLMVPVYDFAGVAVKGKARKGPAEAYGWLRVDDFGVRPIQDPDDHLLWTVVCDVRVSWSQGGRVRPPAPLVGSMPWSGIGQEGVFTDDEPG